jgi:hypothetical protein
MKKLLLICVLFGACKQPKENISNKPESITINQEDSFRIKKLKEFKDSSYYFHTKSEKLKTESRKYIVKMDNAKTECEFNQLKIDGLIALSDAQGYMWEYFRIKDSIRKYEK